MTQTPIDNLALVIRAYARASGLSEVTVSRYSLGNGSRLRDLVQGRRDIGLGTYQRAMEWLSANWPQPERGRPLNEQWPPHVPRPGRSSSVSPRKSRPEASLVR